MKLSISIVLACIVSFFAPSAAQSEDVRIGVFNYPPFLVIEDDKAVSGTTAEILRASFSAMGRDVVFVPLPLMRTITMMQDGSIDAIAFMNPARSLDFHLSERTIGVLQPAFFVRHDNDWRFDGIESLAGLRVANIAGYDYSLSSAEYQAYVDNDPDIVTIGSPDNYLEQVILMIEADRLDTFNEADQAMNYRLRLMGKEGVLRIAGYLGEPLYMHTAFKAGRDGLLLKEQFDEGYSRAIEEGLLEEPSPVDEATETQ